MARLRVRRPRRATVVAAEAVLAVVAAAVAVQSVGGYVVAGVAALVGLAAAGPPPRSRAARPAAGRLRDPETGRRPAPGRRPPGRTGLGLAGGLLPGLHVAEVPTRDGSGLGVIGDGQGFAVLLVCDRRRAPGPGISPTWCGCSPTTRPARRRCSCWWSRSGRAGPVSIRAFPPSRTYRSLPVRGLPLWNRVLLVDPARAGLGPGDRRARAAAGRPGRATRWPRWPPARWPGGRAGRDRAARAGRDRGRAAAARAGRPGAGRRRRPSR